MLLPALPLFFDATYCFMQRVGSPYLWDCVREKVAKMERQGITVAIENSEVEMNIRVTSFHLWALDKGYVICELNIDVQGGESAILAGDASQDNLTARRGTTSFKREAVDGVKWHIRSKLTKKWCQEVVIHAKED